MRAVDDAVLAVLRTIVKPTSGGVDRVYETVVPTRPSSMVGEESVVIVEAEPPFLIYASNAGRHTNRRHAGRALVVPTGFDVTTAALSLGDVQTIQDRIRDGLADRAVDVAGHRSWRIRFDDSDTVLPDPSARLSDGRRLLRGVLRFTLATTR